MSAQDWFATEKPTEYRVFISHEETGEPELYEAHDVDFNVGWLAVEPSDDYAGGDGGAPPTRMFFPAHRVVVIEKVQPT